MCCCPVRPCDRVTGGMYGGVERVSGFGGGGLFAKCRHGAGIEELRVEEVRETIVLISEGAREDPEAGRCIACLVMAFSRA